jgi:hypothetical protein
MTKLENRPQLIPSGIPFTQFPNEAITDPALTGTARSVLLYLFMRANSEGRSWPSQRTIAAGLGFSHNAVLTALKLLDAEGWVTRSKMAKSQDAPVEHQQRHMYTIHGTRPARLFGSEPTRKVNRREKRTGSKSAQTDAKSEPEPVQNSRHNNTQEQQTEQHPSLAKSKRRPNHPWDFLTDVSGPFGLPTETDRQRIRAGGLAKDIRAVLEHHGIPHDEWPEALYRAASTWPLHFENATLTPDAFAKHLPALLRPPLKADQATMNTLAEQAAVAQLQAERQKALT